MTTKGKTSVRVRTIGVREAKTHLSKVLREVKSGVEWIITENGKPIARLWPISKEELPLNERIRELEKQGWIMPRKLPQRSLPPPLPLEEGLAQRWLQEDRRT